MQDNIEFIRDAIEKYLNYTMIKHNPLIIVRPEDCEYKNCHVIHNCFSVDYNNPVRFMHKYPKLTGKNMSSWQMYGCIYTPGLWKVETEYKLTEKYGEPTFTMTMHVLSERHKDYYDYCQSGTHTLEEIKIEQERVKAIRETIKSKDIIAKKAYK